MAVIELPENKYIKIDFTKSYVNEYIYIYLDIYHEEADRLKEKERIADIEYFKENCLNAIKAQQDILEEEASTINWEEITDESQLDTDFIEKSDMVGNLETDYYRVLNHLYKYSCEEDKTGIRLTSTVREFFDQYRYSPSWVNDPINIDGGLYYNCGIYNGEEITLEFYYNKLKELLKINGYLDN